MISQRRARRVGLEFRGNFASAEDITAQSWPTYDERFLIEAGAEYAYSPLNLDAAIIRDTRWMVGINAIEFSPAGG